MIRTQIYLTEEEKAQLETIALTRGMKQSELIREAVDETIFALVFGALLATLTVFVFLRRTRPTLIVAVAIPVSLVATFGVMWILDFTLNTMTLLAMALAVGVVIDDAIIVLENIERLREQGLDAFEAASKGTRQITFAATAMPAVLRRFDRDQSRMARYCRSSPPNHTSRR